MATDYNCQLEAAKDMREMIRFFLSCLDKSFYCRSMPRTLDLIVETVLTSTPVRASTREFNRLSEKIFLMCTAHVESVKPIDRRLLTQIRRVSVAT